MLLAAEVMLGTINSYKQFYVTTIIEIPAVVQDHIKSLGRQRQDLRTQDQGTFLDPTQSPKLLINKTPEKLVYPRVRWTSTCMIK
jgi:hypothetical protein